MTEPAFLGIPIEVRHPFGPSRLDVFLAARLHGYSRSRVQRLIREGKVLFKDRPARAGQGVRPGETVVLLVPRREDPPCRHESLAVLYEDDRLLAVDKPAGVLSHPTDKTVRNSATEVLKSQFPGLALHLVHRLDRETSGVLLLAKDSGAARALAGEFASRRARKEYWALVKGAPSFSSRLVRAALAPDAHEVRVRQRAVGEGEEGAEAATRVEVLARGPRVALVRAVPRTGRLHQIRVHLASLGHPILGDKLYAGDGEPYLKAFRGELKSGELEAPRQMLHARALELGHPAGGRRLRVEAPPPEDFKACMEGLGLSGKLV